MTIALKSRRIRRLSEAGQIGKSLLQATILPYRALTFDLPLIRGQLARNIIVAPTMTAGRNAFAYVSACVDGTPSLKKFLVSSQAWKNPIIENRQEASMRFNNSTTIEVLSCTRTTSRGISVYSFFGDEIAHMKTAEGSRFSDVEVYQSARPAMSRFGMKAMCLLVSTPYDCSGLLYSIWKSFFAVADAPWRVFHVPIHLGNPGISKEFLAQEEATDAQYFAREYLAVFSQQVNSAFSPESIADCVVTGRKSLPYNPKFKYFAFIDPASLSLSTAAQFNDEFCSAIAHCEGDKVVIDQLRAWSANTNGRTTPDDAIAQSAELFREYRVKEVQGDRYASGYLENKLSEFKFTPCKLAKSDLYLEGLMPLLSGGKIDLLDDAVLVTQLKSLERKRGSNDRDKIDHPPDRKDGRRGHDDRSNVIAGLAHMAAAFRNANVEFKLSDVRMGKLDRPEGYMDAAETLRGMM